MGSVDSFEAKAHFAALLKRVEEGEIIVITRHGAPIAQLGPVHAAPDRAQRIEAVARLKALSERYRLDGVGLSELRDDGRR